MTSETENLGARYKIDAGRGNFTVQAFATGLLSFVGHNPTFAVERYGGEIQFVAGNSEVIRCCWLSNRKGFPCSIM